MIDCQEPKPIYANHSHDMYVNTRGEAWCVGVVIDELPVKS